MTPDDWLACTDPDAMLDFLGDRISQRKRRLFACGCCRRIWHLLSYEGSRMTLEAVEQDVDGLLNPEDYAAARASAEAVVNSFANSEGVSAVVWPQRTAAQAVLLNVQGELGDAVATAARAEAGQAVARITSPVSDPRTQFEAARQAARKEQALLLRHLIGNPFEAPSHVDEWPPEVRAFADSLYDGADCSSLLRNALREMDQGELADHFRHTGHPRGCWAVDWILAKH
jgi:hypothetical protein